MLAPDRTRGARRRRGRPPLGRQPAAGQHRHRAAVRAGRAAARRALGLARPAPARAAVGVHRRAGRPRHHRRLTRPTTSPRPSATPTAYWCWPTASCCSLARRPSSSRPSDGGSRGLRGGVRALPARARPLSRQSTPDNALAAGQGPTDPQALAVAGGAAGGLPDRDRADDRVRALEPARQAEGRVLQRALPPGKGKINFGNQQINISTYAKELFQSIDPIKVKSEQQAIAKVQNGDALAALIVPADMPSADPEPGHHGGGQPDRPAGPQLQGPDRAPVRRAGDLVPAERGRAGGLQAGAPGRDLRSSAGAQRGHDQLPRPELPAARAEATRGRSSRARSRRCPPTRPCASRSGRSSTSPIWRSTGLGFASPVLGSIGTPLTVHQTELAGKTTPTDSYAVAIAVIVSLMFVTLAAGGWDAGDRALRARLLAAGPGARVAGGAAVGEDRARGRVRGDPRAADGGLRVAVRASRLVASSSCGWSRWRSAGLAFGALGVAIGGVGARGQHGLAAGLSALAADRVRRAGSGQRRSRGL